MNKEAPRDEELILRIRSGGSGAKDAMEILLTRYKDFVKSRTQPYFLTGADRDDIIQEGMIGLYKAILSYDEKKESSFRGFADICIRRQILTAVKNSTRLKHYPLNSSVSLNSTMQEEEDRETSLMDLLTTNSIVNPEEIYISKENRRHIEEEIVNRLSGLEQKVLSLYLSGMDYREIASVLGKPSKSIDNALQRIRRKVSDIVFGSGR